MKSIIPYLIGIGKFLMSAVVFGQISVDFPADRAVFQRDKSNMATIYISGSYTTNTDRIDARLTALNGGTSTAWTTIKNSPQGGFYSGSLDAMGGWYRLEVRLWRGTQPIDTAQIDHVGIGEVFMIAGQSNGQGFDNYGGPGAQDDRVSCVNYLNVNSNISEEFPVPVFTHLDEHSSIAPRGVSAWSWGKLGDLLTSRLKVPVLFYNAAWYSSSVGNWAESINGTAHSVYDGTTPFEPSGMPYGNFRSVIQRYTPITGLRGVLWLQGEAEVLAKTDSESYFQLLKKVIETGRNESGKNISWMVSLTSYDNRNGINSRTIEGQKQVISSVSNVFQGPNTDLIQIPRNGGIDGVHFDGNGLVQLAEAWNAQLTDDFFSKSEPFKAVSPLNITDACPGNGNVSLSVSNTGFSSINWSNGQNSSIIQVGNGSYRATARDDKGNYIFSPEIRINQNIQPAQPIISLLGSNPVCLGNTATLVSSASENLKWNTGATSEKLLVTQGGDYYVTAQSVYGCEATSAKVAITVLNSPLPEKPTIAVTGALTFCEGGEVSLKSNAKLNSLWSDGESTSSIAVKVSGEYRVKAVDSFGCFSADSDPIVVKVNALPAKPVITLTGASTFCAGEKATLSSNFTTGNVWTSGATSQAISVISTGQYRVTERDVNGCESTSDAISINVNPLPATPVVTALRPTTFCQNDYTILKSTNALSYLWSNGAADQEVEVRSTGNFTVTSKDENGCSSLPSTLVSVTANPNPPTPVISADGPVTFCENLSVNLVASSASRFLWSNGITDKTLKVSSTGTFSVKTINEFNCTSSESNRITTQTLSLPSAPFISSSGKTTVCEGDSVVLFSADGSAVFWNADLLRDSIKVFESGSYSATIRDEKGCFSLPSNAVMVDVKPSPIAPTIRQTGIYTLSAQNNINGGDHVWQLNGNVLSETGMDLKAVQSGSYTVNNSIDYGMGLICVSDFSTPFEFTIDNENPALVVYPNPVVDGKVFVEALQTLSEAIIQVIDTRGIIFKSINISKFETKQEIDVSALPAGMYVVRIVSDQLKSAQKIVITQ